MVEVLIAGAGPAGCVAATILARAGIRVLLLDRARFPRDKLCGDTLNPGTLADLQRLGLADEALIHGLPITGMILTGSGGVQIEGTYGNGRQGRAIRRRDLDAALLQQAIDAGARFQDGVAVRSVLLDDGPAGVRVRGLVVRGRDGRSVRLPACITIAADGRRSTIGFWLGLVRHPRTPRRWAVGAYFENVAGLTSMGEMHVRRGHYLGVAPLPGGIANACLVTAQRAGLRNPLSALEAAIRGDAMLAERFSQARPVSRPTLLGPLALEARSAGMPGLLLAGDAAGFIDPMTGDGLRFAVRGAELAAQVALEMLETGMVSGLRKLRRRRTEAFLRKWRFNRAARALVGSAAGVRAASVGARLVPAVFRKMIRIAGDVG